MDIGSILTAAGAGGVLSWIGRTAIAFYRARQTRAADDNETKRHEISEAADLEKHRDALTFDLLQAAREEVAAARKEANDLRTLQNRMIHFDQALDHIASLIRATATGDNSGHAERQARAFLLRMQQAGEYHGSIDHG